MQTHSRRIVQWRMHRGGMYTHSSHWTRSIDAGSFEQIPHLLAVCSSFGNLQNGIHDIGDAAMLQHRMIQHDKPTRKLSMATHRIGMKGPALV